MTTPASATPGVSVVVGYVSATTAKLVVVSLRGGTIAGDFPGSASIGAWAALGADNSARSGEHVCEVANVTLSALQPFSTYSGHVRCDGEVVPFAFHTLPVSSEVEWSFIAFTCELLGSGYNGEQPWQAIARLQTEAADASRPLLFAAHIDDIHYAYQRSINDTTTGLASTGLPGTTELEWDYALSWCEWFGLIPSSPEARLPARLAFLRSVAHWVQWGDNDIYPNHGRKVSGTSGVPSNDIDLLRNSDYWTNGRNCWKKLFADGMTPPRHQNDGGPASQDDPLYWGCVVGPVRFTAYETNDYVTPYDYDPPGTIGLGQTQINDLLAWLDNDEPYKVVFSICGLTDTNEPLDWWPDELHNFLGQTGPPVGFMNNDKCNGTDGVIVLLKGDTHIPRVQRYVANGSNGLGTTLVDEGELWEIGMGTITGSVSHRKRTGTALDEGADVVYEIGRGSASTQGTTTYSSLALCQVNLERLDVQLLSLHGKNGSYDTLWHGQFSVGSNAPTYPRTRVA